jgi:hypothetical protein
MSFWRRQREPDCDDLVEVASDLVVTIQEATETVKEAIRVQALAAKQLESVASARMESDYDPLS